MGDPTEGGDTLPPGSVIAVIGTGIMGGHMARRLAQA